MTFRIQRSLFACLFGLVTFSFCWTIARSEPIESRAPKQSFALEMDAVTGARSRVKVLMNVEGKLRIRMQEKDKDKKNDVYEPPIKVDAKFYYDEQILAVSDTKRLPATSMRYYYTAKANMDVDQKSVESVLAPDRRYILQELSKKATLSSPLGPLSRNDLDLISVPCNPSYCGLLLPQKPVEIGESWNQLGDRLALWLGLDDVGHCQVQTQLESVENSQAKLRMEGDLTGVIDGITTYIELAAEYRFDLASNQMIWLSMDIKENRSIGQARAGFEIVARIQMRSAAITDSNPLESKYLQAVAETPTDASRHLRFEAKSAGFRLLQDRHWFSVVEENKTCVIKRVEGGKLIAQCNITRLPDLDDETALPMENFQTDIHQALGDHFGEWIVAENGDLDSGLTMMRIVAAGIVDEIPIRWIYYHLTSSEGQRVLCLFTLEAELVEDFGEADRLFVQSIQFTDELESDVNPAPPADREQTATTPSRLEEETTVTR